MGKVKQAFPFVEPADHESIKAYHTGMSLRDYFAAQVLPVLIANNDTDFDEDVECAYMIADKMMEARK